MTDLNSFLAKQVLNNLNYFVAEQVFNNLLVCSFVLSVAVAGMTVFMMNNHMDDVILERQIDTTRGHAGLPTDVTLTPEDFRNNSELAEIFDVSDTENDFYLNLESQEHLKMFENQYADILDAISYFFNKL
jgi:uncharacterized protein (DUF58 family)